jgi:quercetin dioxygenase-like cupin family protein
MQVCAQFGIELKPDWQADQPAPPRSQRKKLWVLGQLVRVLLGSEETGGTFSVAEGCSAPGALVPKHLHRREDEMFYVIEGTYEFDFADRTVVAPAGTFVHVPRGVMHGFANRSNLPAKLVNYHTPGGFEKFFADAGTECVDVGLGPPRGTPDKQWLMNLFTRHGMEVAVH